MRDGSARQAAGDIVELVNRASDVFERGDRLVARRGVGQRGGDLGLGVAAELALDELAEVGGDRESAAKCELVETLAKPLMKR